MVRKEVLGVALALVIWVRPAPSNALISNAQAFSSIHMAVPMPCSGVAGSVSSMLSSINATITTWWPDSPQATLVPVYKGCRLTMTGQAATFQVTATAKASTTTAAAMSSAMSGLVGVLNTAQACNQISMFPELCGATVPGLSAESVAPATNFYATVPLGWKGFDVQRDMILPYTLGSQQQRMAVTLDTGSTIPFTVGFSYLSSSTFFNTSEPGGIEFGGAGNVTGFYGTDTATLGGIRVPGFKFLVSSKDTGVDGQGGGLCGFALGGYALRGGTPAPEGTVSTWKQFSQAGFLASTPRDRVGLWISNNLNLLSGATDFGGELSLGTLNPQRFTGSPIWRPVVPANSDVRLNAPNNTLVWWQFNVPRMAILYADGRSQTICTNCNTIADSGWPEVVITPTAKANIAINSMTGTAPALGCGYKLLLDFGNGMQLKMNLTKDGMPPVAGCKTNYPATGNQRVFTNFRVSGLAPTTNNWYILGLPFLRQYFTVFDYNNLRVGFYTSVQPK